MIFAQFLLIAEEAIAPKELNPNVPNIFGATSLTNGKAICIKEPIPSPD